jgi:putative sterol carrier protein
VFARILTGKQNPMTAYMTGKLKVHGDLGAAMKLKNLF